MFPTFSADNFHEICNRLAGIDKDLAAIIKQHGYPPVWTRPNTFESLVHIILEQQVSLASAKAALVKLQERTRGITPRKLLALSDEALRACYVSRQKRVYLRGLAEAIVSRRLKLSEMEQLPDEAVRAQLTKLKGIGNWTTDVYLMFVLQRADIFPIGDLAAVLALKRAKALPGDTSAGTLLQLTEAWQPHRTVATMILWHHYLSVPVRSKQKESKQAP